MPAPKPPRTLEEWRELSRRLRAEADEIDQAIAVLARRGGAVEPIEAPMFPPLTTQITSDTNNSMTSSTLSIGPSRGPVPDKDGPATKVMKEFGLPNLAELAKALGERHGTVRSWNLRDDLPERVLPAIQKLREKQSKRAGRGK